MSNIIKSVILAFALMTPLTVDATPHTNPHHNTKQDKKKKVKPKSSTVIVNSSKSQYNKSLRIETGIASWYGNSFVGKKTASGERLTTTKMTAAHKKLPLGSVVKVVNTVTKKSVIVTINDRGPFIHRRIIDLSPAAAKKIGLMDTGLASVHMVVISTPTKI